MSIEDVKSWSFENRKLMLAIVCVLVVISFIFVLNRPGANPYPAPGLDVESDIPPTTVIQIGNRIFTDADLRFIFKERQKTNPDITLDDVINDTVDQVLLAQQAKAEALDQRDDIQRQLNFISDRILADAMIDEHLADGISEADLRRLYDANLALSRPQMETRAKQILVPDKETADQVVKLLEDGDSFESLAFAYSIDRVSRDKGGDMGYFTIDMLNADVTQAAFNLEIGVRSDPFRSPRGWHILEVIDRRRRSPPSFEDLRPELETFLRNQSIQDLVMSLRQSTTIEIDNEAIDQRLEDIPSQDMPIEAPAKDTE